MRVVRKLQEIARNCSFTIISISLITLTILILYWQDLSILANEAIQNEAVSHIILVPFLASFLIYRKGELVKASIALERLKEKTNRISLSEITGVALCLSAFLLYWYGSFTFYPLEYHIASLIILLVGITLTLFTIKTLMVLAFPIIFLIFLIPPPSNLTLTAGAALGNLNAQASYTLLKTISVPVTLSWEYGPPTITVDIPSDRPLPFAVDLSCSGIYSLIAFTMFAAFLIYVVRGSIKKRIALIPLGFLMLPILNTLRISLILFIAYRFGEQTAMTMFKTFSGWLLLSLGILLLLLTAEKLLHLQIFGHENKIPSCPKCNDALKINELFCQRCGKFMRNHQLRPDKEFWMKIIGLLLASYLVTFIIQAPVLAFAPKLALTMGNPGGDIDVFPRISDYHPIVFFERDQRFERISGTDASLYYIYFSRNISNPDIYVHVGVDSSKTNLHSWEVCLVTWQTAQGYPPIVNVLESRDIQIMQNPPIAAKYFVFQYPPDYPTLGNRTQVTLYWYLRAPFKTGPTIETKFARISLIIFAENPNDYPKFERKLLAIGQSIAEYWEPLKTQSSFSLGIPTMQLLLGSAILFAVIVQTTEYTKEWRRKTTNLKIFERLAPPEEKQLYQTIKKLSQKTKKTTAQNIASDFEEATDKTAKPTELNNMINNLEKHGIIKADIINILDQPIMIWKP